MDRSRAQTPTAPSDRMVKLVTSVVRSFSQIVSFDPIPPTDRCEPLSRQLLLPITVLNLASISIRDQLLSLAVREEGRRRQLRPFRTLLRLLLPLSLLANDALFFEGSIDCAKSIRLRKSS